MRQNLLTLVASAIVRMYSLALLLYPSQFRKEYAPHMRQVFQDIMRDAVRQAGWMGLLQICGRTIIDVLRSLIYEHYTSIMEISPRKLAKLSSFGAFYLAAFPLWVYAANIGGPDYRAVFVLLALPAFWGIPMMVLGITGQLLPRQRYASLPYLVTAGVVIAYIVLMASRDVVAIDVVRSWGITNRGLNRIFWGGIALLGGMAWSQHERKLGIALSGTAFLYFIMSFWEGRAWTLFMAGLFGGFIYVGIWLYKRKEHPTTSVYSLSWWTVALQGVILAMGITAIVTASQRPLRNTEAYKMAAGFYPGGAVMTYDDDRARNQIEQFIGKPLPPNAYDLSMEYGEMETGGHTMHIRFTAESEEVRKLIRSGMLCFKADINDIPVAQEIPIINDVIKAGWYEQSPNPWHASDSWRWVRNPYHIKGICPMPNRYALEIYMHSPESWWVTIWGWHR